MTPLAETQTVVIADDHMLVRKAIGEILSAMDRVEIVGEAGNGLEAIAMAKQFRPTLITLDSGMPQAGGMEAYGEIRRWAPEIRICVVTGFTSAGQLRSWHDAGADGLLLKSCAVEDMRIAFETVLRGERYISAEVREALTDQTPQTSLTSRERQVLHLLAEGHNNAEIARRLSISTKTVDNHRTRLMAKLGVRSLSQLLGLALKEGLLDQNTQR